MSRILPLARSSLTTRITLGWLGLTLLLLVIFSSLSLRGSREAALVKGRTLLAHEVETTQVRFQAAVADIANDARFLANSPVVQEFLAQGGETARRRVEEEFRALLNSKANYFQVRLLDLTPAGQELVRLDHLDGPITLCPPEQLQAKGQRDYFLESLPLALGAMYLSDVNLNRDFGKITEPHIPTLRAATKAQSSAVAEAQGLVIINVDLRGLFTSIATSRNPAVQLSVANEAGDYVLHPEVMRLFGSELGTADRFSSAPPNEGGLEMETTFPFIPDQARQAHLRLTLPAAELAASSQATDHSVLGGTLLAGLIALVLVFTFARLVSGKLHQLTLAVVDYQPGQEMSGLPMAGSDELSLLAGKFHALAARVNEDLIRVDQARAAAEAASQARENFLAMMSHEIRTPLNSVIGLLRTLQRNRPSPHQAPILEALGSATRQLLNLVNEALDHSKLTAGKMEFLAEPFSLRALLRDAQQTYETLARQKGLSFTADLSSALPDWVQGDATRLNQVLHNLLANALKFTDAGGITLCAQPLEPLGLLLTITDTGIGIAPENVGRLFQPFDQAHGEIARRFGGTGLGLALAREIVVLQGGSLEVASAGANQGSTFTLRLPLSAASAQPAVSTAVPDWRGRRFLYIEDVASNQEIMALLLTETGVQLDTARTGAEGLAAWLADPPDLVLLDLQLPDTDGLTLARTALAQLPQSRCLAVSAQVSETTRQACAATGMLGFLSKPLDAAVCFAEMARHVSPLSGSDALQTLFQEDPVRRQRLFAALAKEFTAHQTTLRQATAEGDVQALRDLRHKLHTAISQFQLPQLGAALEQLIAQPQDAAAQAVALSELAASAAAFGRP